MFGYIVSNITTLFCFTMYYGDIHLMQYQRYVLKFSSDIYTAIYMWGESLH